MTSKKGRPSKKVQGGVKGMKGKYTLRSFGNVGREVKWFWIKTMSGDIEFIQIGWLSKANRAKVLAWWKSNVAQYRRA